jgi:uncharacterized membrane protein
VPALVATAAEILEVIGVACILAATVFAGVRTLRRPRGDLYRSYRQELGRGILLGLEFLVGADIIRTVATEPTLKGVATLAGVVAVRTFLSFTLEVELDGTWPWRRAEPPGVRSGPEPRSGGP